MGNGPGCCSSPNQTQGDLPAPAASDEFINWCFDSLEDNVIVDLQNTSLNNVLRRCDELREQAMLVEFEKMRMNLPQISAERLREAETYFSGGSVWIGKVQFEDKESYLEIIIERVFGTGKRVVDFSNDQFSSGTFSLTAEVDVANQRIKNKQEHEAFGFKILFKWEDEGEDFKLKLLSENFDARTRLLSGTAIINDQGVGNFELLRAISGAVEKVRLRDGSTTAASDYDMISSYTNLALKKSIADLEGTSVKCFNDSGSGPLCDKSLVKSASRDGDDASLDGYAYE